MGRRRKNKVLEEVTIGEMVAEGKCIAKVEGKAVFVPRVAPGDVVDIRLVKQRKKYAEGEVLRFHHYSELRTTPFCKHFGTCGGCKWQHLPYEQQLRYKQQQVLDALERIGKVALPECPPILPSAKTRFYRNKLEFTFSPQRWLTQDEVNSAADLDRRGLGFHVPRRFDRIVDLEECYLQAEPSNSIRLALRQFALENELSFYNIFAHEGLLRNLIIRTSSTEEVMVIVQFGEDQPEAITRVMDFLAGRFPEITSLQYVINQKKNETFHDLPVICYKGQPYITEVMEDLRFRIGAKSFFQTNSQQALELYRITRQFAGLTGNEVVFDLYTGTGTIANFVARQAKEVIGIESVPQAIADAKVNAADNGITNTRFFAGDMKEVLSPAFLAAYPRPDVVITDPPRAGMHEKVVRRLLELESPRVVYVSCNPATQARDVQLLSEKYHVTAIQPVDMFPHTHHVENVLCLDKKA